MPYILVDTIEQLEELLEKILQYKGNIYADIESTGLDWIVDEVLLFQIRLGDITYVVNIRKLGYSVLKDIVSTFNQTDNTIVFHNAKFDMKFLYRRTGLLINRIYDTMVCESLLHAGVGKVLYSLVELGEKYADTFMDKESRKDFIDFPQDAEFTEKMLTYSALDVEVLEPIYTEQMKQILETREERVLELEMKLLPVLVDMESAGVGLDKEKWLNIEKEAIETRSRLEREFKEEVIGKVLVKEFDNGFEVAKVLGIPVKTKKLTILLENIKDVNLIKEWAIEKFNVNSPIQLKRLLHYLGIKVKDTNEKTLFSFTKHEIVKKLIELRGLGKQISSYGTQYLRHVHPVTNKIHTEFYQTGTVTGRLSSGNPNVQQVPRVGGYRECFIPANGNVFIGIDYNQQEYRLTGAMSKEPVIIDAYRKGYDMHIATAAMLFNKKIDEVTKDERQTGKNTNFALIYGSSEFGLSRNFKITIERATEIVKTFWEGYPRLAIFKKMVEEKIMELGFSSTALGRRRYNAEKPVSMNSGEFMQWKGRVLREGFNLLVQGGCADVMKQAMVNIFYRNPFGDRFRLIIQVHDELLAEVDENIQEEAFDFMKKEMEDALRVVLGEIPSLADGKISKQWGK